MKKSLVLLTVLPLVLIVAACGNIVGSGVTVSEDYAVSEFDEIDIGGVWDASIKRGDAPRVTVHVDDNLLERVDVEVSNGKLKISLDGNITINRSKLALTIETPELKQVEVSGAGAAVIGGFEQSDLTLKSSGASTIVADIKTEQLDVDIDGSSTVVITGTAVGIELDVNGASSADFGGLVAETAEVDINGASDADLTGVARVVGSANGVSDIVVSRTASVDVDASGISDVTTQ